MVTTEELPVSPLSSAGEGRKYVRLGLVETVGKYCDRACLTRARAARKLAAAAAMFWFEEPAFSSSSFSWGSWKASHHLPRFSASFWPRDLPFALRLGNLLRDLFVRGRSLNGRSGISRTDHARGLE